MCNRLFWIAPLLSLYSLTNPLYAQQPWSMADFREFARGVSVALTPVHVPDQEHLITAGLKPGMYKEAGNLQIMPAWNVTWWVSPNLALQGASGTVLRDDQVILHLRAGLVLLPGKIGESLFQPEATLAHGIVTGHAATSMRWNEISWGYSANVNRFLLSGKIASISSYLRTVSSYRGAGVKLKAKASTTALIVSAGTDIWHGLRIFGSLAFYGSDWNIGTQLEFPF